MTFAVIGSGLYVKTNGEKHRHSWYVNEVDLVLIFSWLWPFNYDDWSLNDDQTTTQQIFSSKIPPVSSYIFNLPMKIVLKEKRSIMCCQATQKME